MAVAVSALFLGACATGTQPQREARRVQVSDSYPVEVEAEAGPPVGEVLPVFVTLMNTTDAKRWGAKSGFVAITTSGDRVGALSVGEAAKRAGGAEKLENALPRNFQRTVQKMSAAPMFSAAQDRARSFFESLPPPWRILNAESRIEVMTPWGRNAWFEPPDVVPLTVKRYQGSPFGPVEVGTSFEGYLFFPNRDFTVLEVRVANETTNETEVLVTPWNNFKIFQQSADPARVGGSIAQRPPNAE